MKTVSGKAGLQKTVARLEKEARLLDNLLQETNWRAGLIEE